MITEVLLKAWESNKIDYKDKMLAPISHIIGYQLNYELVHTHNDDFSKSYEWFNNESEVDMLQWYRILLNYEHYVINMEEANIELHYHFPGITLNIVDLYNINCIFVNGLDLGFAISEIIEYLYNNLVWN